MDALLETMTTDDYDSLGAHRRGESSPESKGTEFGESLNGEGFSGSPAIIPPKDLTPPSSPADAEFFKESEPKIGSKRNLGRMYHGSKVVINDNTLRRYQGGGKQDSGAIFVTPSIEYANQYKGTSGALYAVDLGTMDIFDPENEQDIDRLADGYRALVGTDYDDEESAMSDYYNVISGALGNLLDWAVGGQIMEAVEAAGYGGMRLRERPGTVSGNEDGSFSISGEPIESVALFKGPIKAQRVDVPESKIGVQLHRRPSSRAFMNRCSEIAKVHPDWDTAQVEAQATMVSLGMKPIEDVLGEVQSDKEARAVAPIEEDVAEHEFYKHAPQASAKVAGHRVEDTGKYDEEKESRIREVARETAQYYEHGQLFDPKGDYLCGGCHYMLGNKLCAFVEGEVSKEHGTCRYWKIADGKAPVELERKYDKKLAGYAERTSEEGWGCKRCEYGGEAKKPDNEGRKSWCQFFGMHIVPDACCYENELPGDVLFNIDGSKQANFVSVAELTKSAAKSLYHVTFTDKIPSIKAKGILPLQTSNWVKGQEEGERYGEGEIFAMDNPADAVRWASKMDWEFNKGMGTGNISIVSFRPGAEKWKTDSSDPISQAANKGKWLKAVGSIKPEQIIGVHTLEPEMVKAVIQNKPVKLSKSWMEEDPLKPYLKEPIRRPKMVNRGFPLPDLEFELSTGVPTSRKPSMEEQEEQMDFEDEKVADVPTKSYGMGTPIGGTDNPDAGASDEPEELQDPAELSLNMTSAFEVEASQNYAEMFNMILSSPKGKEVKPEIDQNIAWAKQTLKKSDKIVWFLKWYRLSLIKRYLPERLDKEVKKINKGPANIPSNITQLKQSLDHFMGLEFKQIEDMQFEDTPEEVLEQLEGTEEEVIEQRVGDTHAMPTDFKTKEKTKGDTIFLQLPGGWAWWLLDRAACPLEAAAMGHCGNSPRRNTKDRILSLREPVKTKKGEDTWAPHATFILREGGLLGEMKGRSNTKVGQELHPAIIALLKDKRIFGILGGGYKPEANFHWEDLTKKQQNEIKQANPNFGKEPDWAALGKSKKLLAEIAEKLNIQPTQRRVRGKTVESTSFNYRIDAFVINEWNDITEMCRNIGSQEAAYAAEVAMEQQRKGDKKKESDVDDEQKPRILADGLSHRGSRMLQEFMRRNDEGTLEDFVRAQQGYNSDRQFQLDLTHQGQLFSLLDYVRQVGGPTWDIVAQAFNVAVSTAMEDTYVENLSMALGDYLYENSEAVKDKRPVTSLFYGPEGSQAPYDWSASPVYEGISFEDAKKLADTAQPDEYDLSSGQLYINVDEPYVGDREGDEFEDDPVGAFEDLLSKGGMNTPDERQMQLQFRSSLLKKALIEMNESPSLLPPRDDLKGHMDQQEQDLLTKGVMQGVREPLNPKKKKQRRPQIDPRINPDGVVASEKTAEYTPEDQARDEEAEYFLDQMEEAQDEAKRHFMQESYIQQLAEENSKTMDEMWNMMGDEYTAEFYGYPYKTVPDFTDEEVSDEQRKESAVDDERGEVRIRFKGKEEVYPNYKPEDIMKAIRDVENLSMANPGFPVVFILDEAGIVSEDTYINGNHVGETVEKFAFRATK